MGTLGGGGHLGGGEGGMARTGRVVDCSLELQEEQGLIGRKQEVNEKLAR